MAASLAARVIEAQYHDAVRTRTADLYTAYVDVQEAQTRARITRDSLTSFEELAKVSEGLADSGQVARAAFAATDAEVALRKARFTLADLLDIPDAEAERLEIKDESENREAPLPTLAELTQLALRHRPDLRANRLGLWRAQVEWLRAWVEQWPDFFVLAGPDRRGRPVAGKEAIALPWASGLLVSFPDAGHHRGKVARAQINVAQSRIELARVERQVVLDVRLAHIEYTHNLAVKRRLKEEVLPAAMRVRDDAFKQFRDGEADKHAFLGAQSEHKVVLRDYLNATFRCRRGALALNTAIGKRVLP